jgi:phosphate acyltransferase
VTRSNRSPQGGPSSSGTARIAVDLLGGDGAPAVVVDGALRACSADPDLELFLVGPQKVADEVIGALPHPDRHRLAVRVVDAAVGMADSPLLGVRRDTTVRAAAELVYAGHADAMVSAGSSGAAVAAASHVLGRFPGVRRPSLAATLPSTAGPVVLLDVGVGLDATMLELVQHAVLGAPFAAVAHGIAKPRVGLLSIGSEPGKGDRLRRAVALALTDLPLPAGGRYVGLVEGHDVPLGGPADVVVTDGFTGNVLLKGMEGAFALARTDHQVTPETAAVLLGVSGTVVVCHGAATGGDLASGIALAARLHREAVVTNVATLAEEPLSELASAGGLTIRDALGERS